MKRLFFTLIMTLFFWELSSAQMAQEKYVLSFPLLSKNDTLLVSEKVTFKRNPMTKQEALTYVYSNDTSKLICRGDFFDMMNEKKTGEWVKEILPDKCFRIETNSFYLIANTSYDCHNRGEIWCLLNLKIYDKLFNLVDTLTVFRGDENRLQKSSIINTRTLKSFVFNNNEDAKLKEFNLFAVNSKTLKFELIKTVKVKIGSSYNLSKTLRELGFENQFYK